MMNEASRGVGVYYYRTTGRPWDWLITYSSGVINRGRVGIDCCNSLICLLIRRLQELSDLNCGKAFLRVVFQDPHYSYVFFIIKEICYISEKTYGKVFCWIVYIKTICSPMGFLLCLFSFNLSINFKLVRPSKVHFYKFLEKLKLC